MSDAKTLLELIDVSKTYDSVNGFVTKGERQTDPISVLQHISLQVKAGESVAIIGSSGSGKSTLLNIMGSLDKATSGRVLLDSKDLSSLDDNALAQMRNCQIGFIFQSHHLLPQCTVLENVLVPTLAGWPVVGGTLVGGTLVGGTLQSHHDRALRLLKRVGLAERISHRPGQLSGGERQRAAVVRALINTPSLLLADEPTGSLDYKSAEGITQLLEELNREEGVAVVLVTHAAHVAKRMHRVLELRQGTL